MKLRVLALLLLFVANPLWAACTVPGGVDALRGTLLALSNAERATHGLPALRLDPRLTEAAQTQACRMAERGRLSHRGSWFAGLGRRLRREGYAYAVAVENTGMGHRDAPQIIQGWMASPEHRVNMLNPAVRDAGYGVAQAQDGQLHWSMIAAAHQR